MEWGITELIDQASYEIVVLWIRNVPVKNDCMKNVFITPILNSLVILEIWLALNSAIYSQIAPLFALIRITF